MERMWAPWRMKYIKSHSDEDPCFLCASVRQKRDPANLVVGRGTSCFVILNRYPYNVGHLMVAPRSHKNHLAQMTASERSELLALTARAQEALDRSMKPHGYNIGINQGRVAGAGLLGHIHVHVVPRWDGDTNFMPVTGGTKVMPLSLSEAYRAIRRHF